MTSHVDMLSYVIMYCIILYGVVLHPRILEYAIFHHVVPGGNVQSLGMFYILKCYVIYMVSY